MGRREKKLKLNPDPGSLGSKGLVTSLVLNGIVLHFKSQIYSL